MLTVHLSKIPQNLTPRGRRFPLYEFHILADVRKKYQFDDELYTYSGNVIFPNYHSVRLFAQKINAHRDLVRNPEQAIKIGQLNAMALIDEIFHYVIRTYEEKTNPGFFRRLLASLNEKVGISVVNNTLLKFTTYFPPLDVHRRECNEHEWISRSQQGKPNNEIALEEMIMLYFANFNPAFAQFKELFDDAKFSNETPYKFLIEVIEQVSLSEKGFGLGNVPLFKFLRAPILSSPNSLKGQLEFMRREWGLMISGKYTDLILSADDLIKEDSKLVFGGVPSSPQVPRYSSEELQATAQSDEERFTLDTDWMPNVVLLAKNTHVWLHQLSKKYQRSIVRLDQIPDEELDQLARWNITGLWLIGVWERSRASQKIKRLMGNPEAAASAYSIYEYEIACDLGGEEAFQNFKQRAMQRGIRLAGDMVPNHMGIDSKWVIQRPDYFLQLEYSPFPNYRFTGVNLSEHTDVQIRIEDGYWNRSDAAVVFEHIDNRTGVVRYIYHGNDGTNMPWNDTAQLNFLKPDVREAVIQMILHVAQKFPIIRFDAAMTLTRQHYQRLWFPCPGSGGDIPSRADCAMSKAEFDKHMKQEFWREVVDRINIEMPNTLLLAEAFWLLEGYFVRTLGMHRVYNSAFMHMLMKEENAQYRQLIKNTLEFNPEILKRYVNFMSNPDEQTAVAQFGKDDKYFGTALMLVTLPGLPMFAHGQIEGFTEKYGMEYMCAYYDEQPDQELIRRHEREIFPVLKKRYLFSQVKNFELYDFEDERGFINENVFAYSNRAGSERALVCFHNKYEDCKGWIRTTVEKVAVSDGHTIIAKKHIADALQLQSDEAIFYVFQNQITGLEYLCSGKAVRENGFYLELRAFQYSLFMNFREIHDSDGEYERLASALGWRGVRSVQEEIELQRLAPVHFALCEFLSQSVITAMKDDLIYHRALQQKNILDKYLGFVWQIQRYNHRQYDEELFVREFTDDYTAFLNCCWFDDDSKFLLENEDNFLIALSWLALGCAENVEIYLNETQKERVGLFESLRLETAFKQIFQNLGWTVERQRDTVALIRILLDYGDKLHFTNEEEYSYLIYRIVGDPLLSDALRLNVYNCIWYYNKEQFDNLMLWLRIITEVNHCREGSIDSKMSDEFKQRILSYFKYIEKISEVIQYNFSRLKEILREGSLLIK